MKAPKALKRLGKIEALMADLIKRYSSGAPSVREALQTAKTAVTKAKQTVNSQLSYGTAKNALKRSGRTGKEQSKKAEARKTKLAVANTGSRSTSGQKATAKKGAVKKTAARATKKPNTKAAPAPVIAPNTGQ